MPSQTKETIILNVNQACREIRHPSRLWGAEAPQFPARVPKLPASIINTHDVPCT